MGDKQCSYNPFPRSTKGFSRAPGDALVFLQHLNFIKPDPLQFPTLIYLLKLYLYTHAFWETLCLMISMFFYPNVITSYLV